MNLANNITYPLITYAEEPVLSELRQRVTSEHVQLIDSSSMVTFLQTYLDRETEIMKSDAFQRLIHPDRKGFPETVNPAYTLINHSKINFVKAAKEQFPDYSHYAWVDFGMFRDLRHIPRNLDLQHYPKDKFIFHTLIRPQERISEELMLRTNQVFITGSTFVLPREKINEYQELYEAKLIQWQKRGLADDDQSVILQLYYDQPGKFHLSQDPEWFSLYRLLPQKF